VSEIWKDVIGYEGTYQVSSMGRVKSLKSGKRRHGRILRGQRDKDGYLRVGLCRDGERKSFMVHRLVLEAHVGPTPTPEHEVNHRNGDKTDNRVENLEWVTHQQNCNHAYRILAIDIHAGEANGHAKLTDEKVIAIRELWAAGEHTQTELGEMFGVAQCTISNVVLRQTWQHVP